MMPVQFTTNDTRSMRLSLKNNGEGVDVIGVLSDNHQNFEYKIARFSEGQLFLYAGLTGIGLETDNLDGSIVVNKVRRSIFSKPHRLA